MPKTIDYYFTPASPWSYLGHARFMQILERSGAKVNVKPVDYGKIFPVSGGLPLKQRAPQRQAYRLAELRRWRDWLGVPLTLEPKYFPYSTDAAVALIIAADKVDGVDAAMKLSLAIMKACWAEERNCADAATLEQIARGQKLDAAPLTAKADDARGLYQAYTQEAIERQVFGAPTYAVNGELFWGQDRLEFLERALAR
jgi:2-hydroxychromene-2-carboxylate isomerase